MLEAKGLSFHYGKKKVLENITFSVQKGRCLAFLVQMVVGKQHYLN